MSEIDEDFFARADEHIDLSNKQLATANRGQVSASMMFSVARFNSWVSACEFESQAEMDQTKEEIVKYFVGEYEKMLREHVQDYIDNFDKYMKIVEED